jgi:hypothetical protein
LHFVNSESINCWFQLFEEAPATVGSHERTSSFIDSYFTFSKKWRTMIIYQNRAF